MPKDGIYPLEGIVETDWSESNFTMNWIITRPNRMIVFEKDKPLVMLTPVARGKTVTQIKAAEYQTSVTLAAFVDKSDKK